MESLSALEAVDYVVANKWDNAEKRLKSLDRMFIVRDLTIKITNQT